MPESVRSAFNRTLDWIVNRQREPRNWSSIEYEVIRGLCLQAGRRGTVRIRNFEDHGSFENMISDLGDDTDGAPRHTVVVPSEVVIATSTTIPGNLTLVRTQDGKFVIAGGANLIFNPGAKLITEPNVLVFDCSQSCCGIGGLFTSNAIDYYTPDMFGGGEDGLRYLVETSNSLTSFDDVPVPLKILRSIDIVSGDLYIPTFTPITYIKPDVQITIGSGVTLTIDAMTAAYAHDAFVGTGTLVLNNAPIRQRYLMVHDAVNEPTTPPSGYAYIYFDSSDGNKPKIKDSSGNTFIIEITQE